MGKRPTANKQPPQVGVYLVLPPVFAVVDQILAQMSDECKWFQPILNLKKMQNPQLYFRVILTGHDLSKSH